MRVVFDKDSVTLTLLPQEFGFLFRSVNDRIHSIPEDKVAARLGLPFEDAESLLREILAAEIEARRAGQHWLPPRDSI